MTKKRAMNSMTYAGARLMNRNRLPVTTRAMLHAVLIEGAARWKGGDMKVWKVMQAAEKAARLGHLAVLKGCLARLGIDTINL